jgi:hypothetical protein
MSVKYQFSGGAAGHAEELGAYGDGHSPKLVIMVTAGHMACGPVTAMRWLSGALSYRRRQEDASRHHSVGRGCPNGHVGRHFGAPGYGRAARDHASGWHGAPGARCGGGGCRVRSHRAGGFRVRSQPGGSSSGGPQVIVTESDECVFSGRAARYAWGSTAPWVPGPGKRRNPGQSGRPGTRADAGAAHYPGRS